MHLTRLRVTNHSRLADLDIEVRRHLVLVGANDVGKSSLLRCLDLLLGASTAQLYARITSDDVRDPELPFVIEAELTGFDQSDKALFPDEISISEATGDASLTLRLSATFDSNQTLSVERAAPGGGTGRQLSREQVAGVGWQLLGAMSASRDLRDDRKSVIDDILRTVELGTEKADFEAIAAQLKGQLGASDVLGTLRTNLASQLSKALPDAVGKDDLHFVPGATAEEDVLNDVRLQVSKDGVPRNLGEQSDGTRALYAIALYDLVSVGANMVAIDEPEVHLHPTSQRNLAKLLQSSANQKFIATQSADIVGAFAPECVVVVRGGGVIVQPATNFLTNEERMTVRWWVRDRLEPLTARRVAAVEGISDRIILECAAELTGRNLDRLGVSVAETGGAGDMGAIIKLFGKDGFDVPISMLIDADAANETAAKLGVPVSDLKLNSVWVSTPDLEAEYVAALGADAVWSAVSSSPHFKPNELTVGPISGTGGSRTEADVAAFCRWNSKYKVRAAMTVAPLLTASSASAISSIDKLLNEIATL
ncbi:ATP-dependent endonuclease [Kribbella sp. NPDC058245]|uniref:ATP-dependent nuclease n=1 Tax=Kribbella sp. NPDC058245 TaxID=3346399 RepID=UPI0036E9FDDD